MSLKSNLETEKITKLPSDTIVEPPVTKDARFRAGRKLIQSGKAGENAIQLFATLVEESRAQYGLDRIETSSSYYEYGNALFRAFARQQQSTQAQDATTNTKSQKPIPPKTNRVSSRSKLAEAAEKRMKLLQSNSSSNETTSSSTTQKSHETPNDSQTQPETEPSSEKDETIDDDISLALEMMENAFSIMDQYIYSHTQSSTTSSQNNYPYISWCQIQMPRVLCGIGDIYSFLKQHADAADAYIRAIPYRDELVKQYSNPNIANNESVVLSLDHLKARRLYVEVHVLIAEELLAHPSDQDIVSTPTPILSQNLSKENEEIKPILLVKASERIEFAKGYYEKGREELQETVFLMGKIAAKGIDLGMEKEDVCFLATILMGVGNSLADLEEEEEENVFHNQKSMKKAKIEPK